MFMLTSVSEVNSTRSLNLHESDWVIISKMQ